MNILLTYNMKKRILSALLLIMMAVAVQAKEVVWKTPSAYMGAYS